MPKTATAPEAVLGLDVGKSSHWACLVTRDGETAVNSPVANSEGDLGRLFSQVDQGTLVMVDRVRNIGALAIRRARMAGLDVAYLPGIAAHGAAGLFAGDAKTDERDAMVIAKTALGIPDALLPVPRDDARLGAARSMAAQRDHMVTCATRDKNRLRSILLESCPPFEALADLSDPRWVNMLEKLGGPWGGRRRRQGRHGRRDEGRRQDEDGRRMGRHSQLDPAARIHGGGRGARCPGIAEALADDATYACLLTVPGIGPRTASELVIDIDIADFPDHHHLASYCGIAPRNRRSGTSVSSVGASRQGNKRLKNLLIFSCNSLTRSRGRFGEHYRKCRDRGMCHGEALKAVARKRIKVVYAIMRDKVPYAA